jgi:S-adenosylmethionine hydrolase
MIDGVYDVLLRGTAVGARSFYDGWSDIDLSVIFDKPTMKAYDMVRDSFSKIKKSCDIKISLTLVDVDDFKRSYHNHGIKPVYYTSLLGSSSESLLLGSKQTCYQDDGSTELSRCGTMRFQHLISDCFCNIVYLIHDIRSRYLNTDINDLKIYAKDALHIIRRSKYLVINSYFIATGEVLEFIDERALEVFKELNLDYFKSISDFRNEWSAIAKDRERITQIVDVALSVCNYVYKEACAMFDIKSQKRKIVVFSDCIDIAFAEVYQKLVGELDKLGVMSYDIAPLVEVASFSVTNAAFSLRLMAEVASPGTVFLVIVNGQSNNPERIFGETENGIVFVGNNSGYFSWLLQDFGIKEVYKTRVDRIANNKSFGGRNVQTPLAAQIVSGMPYDSLGTIFDRSLLNMEVIKDGTIVHIDNFGLMKVKLQVTEEIERSTSIDVYVNSELRATAKFRTKMKTASDGEWCVFPGSSLDPALLEVAKVRSFNSAADLGASVGDIITLACKNG